MMFIYQIIFLLFLIFQIQYPNPISHVREWTQLNNDVVHEQHPLQIQVHPPEGVKRSQKVCNTHT